MIQVTKISTQKETTDGVIFRGRTEDDIARMVFYTLRGNQTEKPLMSGIRGFYSTNPSDIVTEIINIQTLYNKLKGMRTRGFIVTIPMADLHSECYRQELERISYDIAGYFFYKGFQSVYGIFSKNNTFSIWYVINPVSYEDGSKFRINNADKLSDLHICAQSVVNRVTGVVDPSISFNFSSLEYYPYSYEINNCNGI